MSNTKPPELVKNFLWGKAAGRCQYRGCNLPLYEDPLKKSSHNIAYHAHIIGDSSSGPRGDNVLSEQYAKDISNLMLLCDSCHRRVDRTEVEIHTVDFLKKMKKEHEDKIRIRTDIKANQDSHILLYGANIGSHASPLTYSEAANAIIPTRFPNSHNAIEIGLKNSPSQDESPTYWQFEVQNLKTSFDRKIKSLIDSGELEHLSVFALAPQPLLIELGRLIGDITPSTVHQRRREPSSWKWNDETTPLEFKTTKPKILHNTIALKLSLSASISDERIHKVLGDEVAIWEITIEEPHNDFLQSPEHLSKFKKIMRKLFNEIKNEHGQDSELNIFPAIPASIAVELGRVWMPKADLPLHIYEQNTKRDGFFKAHTITNMDN